MSVAEDLIAGMVASGIVFTGPKGDKGDKGDRGEVGPVGPQGREGLRGPVGPAGAAGQGSVGPIGPVGLKGAAGQDGAPGEPGRDGADGLPGPYAVRSIPERDRAGRIAFVQQVLNDGTDRRLAVKRDHVGRFSELVEVSA